MVYMPFAHLEDVGKKHVRWLCDNNSDLYLTESIPYPNTVNSSSCEVPQTDLIKQWLKSNSKKYNKIHPIED
uniref:Uncharacterized protein n=1 Tax=viral metagenome TaxID=1070528 RepID=A0A6C0L0V8_9ZZZZ|tara:strand:+ start:1536 stop:1751 length:216 start_codon:yes stop_codon:yes gene_type:complete